MIRLLYAVSDGNIGGAGKAVLSLLRHADRSRFAPALALPAGSALQKEAATLGVPIYSIACPPDRSLSLQAFFAYLRLLRRERFDIVHAHGSAAAVLAAICCAVPLRVVTRHCEQPKRKSILRRWLYRLPPLSSLYRIAVSEPAYRQLLAEGALPKRICRIPNGAERFAMSSEQERRLLCCRLGIPEAAPVVGFFGRLEPIKGADLLPAFARRLSKRLPGARLLVCGDGSLRQSLQKADCPALMLGLRDPIAPYLALCTLTVSLSRSEASPLAAAESVCMGIPVLAPRLPAFRSLLGEAGIYYTPECPEEAADRAAALLADPAAYACFRNAASACRSRLPTPEQMTQATESFLLSCLKDAREAGRGKRGKPAPSFEKIQK